MARPKSPPIPAAPMRGAGETAPPLAAKPAVAPPAPAPVAKTRAIRPPEAAASAPAAQPAPVATPAPAPAFKPAPAEPVAAIRAAPVKLAEATRAVAEETVAAFAKAADAVVAAAPQTRTDQTEPRKGFTTMATSFAPAGFTPAPEKVQALFGDFQSRAKETMAKSAKLVEDLSEFAKGNVEAAMASGRVAAKGAETLGQDAAEYSKKSFEGAASAFKEMVAAKSPTELLKLQSDYARTSFDAAVAEGSRFSEAWLKLIGEIAQPLSSRAALAAEKIKAPLA